MSPNFKKIFTNHESNEVQNKSYTLEYEPQEQNVQDELKKEIQKVKVFWFDTKIRRVQKWLTVIAGLTLNPLRLGDSASSAE